MKEGFSVMAVFKLKEMSSEQILICAKTLLRSACMSFHNRRTKVKDELALAVHISDVFCGAL